MEGAFDLVLSPLVVEELHNVLRRDRFRKYLSVRDAEEFVAALLRKAELAEDQQDPPRISADPGDDYLPALAAATGVDFSCRRSTPNRAR